MPRAPFIALIALACAACGQPASDTQTPAAPAASAPAPAPERSDAELQAAVAALPAPLNEASYANGARVFAQCRSCHVIEAGAGNRVGPNLHGVFGRKAAQAASFRYSPAMQSSGLTWDQPTLDRYLENPRAAVPGGIMVFAGVRKPEDRRDLVAYLAVNSKE
jgi:cytochrome c